MKSKAAPAIVVQPRYRVLRGREIAMGPGKAELLEQVQAAGSIAEAATRMGMSYMRAWTLVKTMERSFKQPLVKMTRGGAGHGGAGLTATGEKVLQLYRSMEQTSLRASQPAARKLLKLLA